MTRTEKIDPPESFEEQFLAAYLVAVEKCDVVRHQVPSMERKHANLAALGYSSKTRKYVGCDVLDWLDGSWPPEMKSDKVLPKLRERVELFGRRITLEELGRRARTSPRKRFAFFGFGPLSPRLLAALPAVGSEAGVETETFHGESLWEVARSVAALSVSPEAPDANPFVRSVRLLTHAGWRPGIALPASPDAPLPSRTPGKAVEDEVRDP